MLPYSRHARAVRVHDLNLERLRCDGLQRGEVVDQLAVGYVRTRVPLDAVELLAEDAEVDGAPGADADRAPDLPEKKSSDKKGPARQTMGGLGDRLNGGFTSSDRGWRWRRPCP